MKTKKPQVKTWQFSFFLAALVLIFFLLLNSSVFGNWIGREIPDAYCRTFAVGLILAVLVFLACGIHLHYMCPVKEKIKTKCEFSPLGIMDR